MEKGCSADYQLLYIYMKYMAVLGVRILGKSLGSKPVKEVAEDLERVKTANSLS